MAGKAVKAKAVEPVAETPPAEPLPVRAYKLNLGQRDGAGKPRAHPWLPWTLVIDGCTSPEDARAKLRDMVDAAVFQVEPVR